MSKLMLIVLFFGTFSTTLFAGEKEITKSLSCDMIEVIDTSGDTILINPKEVSYIRKSGHTTTIKMKKGPEFTSRRGIKRYNCN